MRSRQAGVSLIELVMFIVIVGIALAGTLLVMDRTSGNGADALVRKQALTVADALLDEIETRAVNGPCSTPLANSARTGFAVICDYKGYSSTSGVPDINGVVVSGLGGYKLAPAIEVTSAVWGNIPAGSSVQITVHVTDPVGNVYRATGFRTAY